MEFETTLQAQRNKLGFEREIEVANDAASRPECAFEWSDHHMIVVTSLHHLRLHALHSPFLANASWDQHWIKTQPGNPNFDMLNS